MNTTVPAVTRATRREWFGLALLVVPMLLLSIDLTVLFFALPAISSDLNPTASQSLWIVHAYGFLVAGFLVTMGRLGDRFGPGVCCSSVRRRSARCPPRPPSHPAPSSSSALAR